MEGGWVGLVRQGWGLQGLWGEALHFVGSLVFLSPLSWTGA